MAADRLYGLPPLLDARARVLILGSFPSKASLAAGQYYAHPQNQFWRILGAVLGQELANMEYADRIAAASAAGIAIWDVYASCSREGSLDASIRDAVTNRLADLKKSAPALRLICFNGRTAAKHMREVEALGYAVAVLPSTSPANASWRFESKLDAWRKALEEPLLR
ncbi:MAG: DNA-deoxyinosine glycosylase [Sulfuritalea sp.]|nr:DNA-deoxyinosine glycosylase [Sulfuritalea sp.]